MIRPEHPDPLLARDEWLSLNGEWGFAEDRRLRGVRERWQVRTRWPDKVTVPFCLESAASGLGRRPRGLDFWYSRQVRVPDAWRGKRIFLRLGAVDYLCRGYVNGQLVGEHEGGFTPMAWRIDPWLKDGDNHVCLYVAETRDGRLPRGKQTHLPFSYAVFYPPFSGVWQPVWLEARGQTNVFHAHAVAAPEGGAFDVHIDIDGPTQGELEIRLTHPDGTPDATVRAPVTEPRFTVRVPVERAAEWSPDSPALYEVEYVIRRGDEVIDRAHGYAGLRRLRVADGKVWLNDRPFYHKLLLYQAYYPHGWATAADDETLRRDVELIKRFGMNGVRVHQTLADPRFLYWCDKLGLLVWEEMPSPFVFADVDRHAFERLWREAIARDRGHPAIGAWVLFNETWGVFDLLRQAGTRAWVRRMVAAVRQADSSRPVIDNSGCEHLDSDILDFHQYLKGARRIRALYRKLANPGAMGYQHWRNLYYLGLGAYIHSSPLAPSGQYRGEPVVVSECGGHGFRFYGDSSLTLEEALRQTFSLLGEHPHLQGFGYTQFCDTAQEHSGLVSFDRQPKIDPDLVRSLVAPLESR